MHSLHREKSNLGFYRSSQAHERDAIFKPKQHTIQIQEDWNRYRYTTQFSNLLCFPYFYIAFQRPLYSVWNNHFGTAKEKGLSVSNSNFMLHSFQMPCKKWYHTWKLTAGKIYVIFTNVCAQAHNNANAILNRSKPY